MEGGDIMTEKEAVKKDRMQMRRMFTYNPVKFCTWANKQHPDFRKSIYRQLRKCFLDKKYIQDYYYENILGILCFRFGLMTWPELERIKGEYYGYPKCCIDNFINLKFNGKPPGEYMMIHYGPDVTDGTGYVRCPKCRGKEVIK
jgi:hypothetical protein